MSKRSANQAIDFQKLFALKDRMARESAEPPAPLPALAAGEPESESLPEGDASPGPAERVKAAARVFDFPGEARQDVTQGAFAVNRLALESPPDRNDRPTDGVAAGPRVEDLGRVHEAGESPPVRSAWQRAALPGAENASVSQGTAGGLPSAQGSSLKVPTALGGGAAFTPVGGLPSDAPASASGRIADRGSQKARQEGLPGGILRQTDGLVAARAISPPEGKVGGGLPSGTANEPVNGPFQAPSPQAGPQGQAVAADRPQQGLSEAPLESPARSAEAAESLGRLRVGMTRSVHERVRAAAALACVPPTAYVLAHLEASTPQFDAREPMTRLQTIAKQAVPAISGARRSADVRMQVLVSEDLHRRLTQLAALRAQTLAVCLTDILEWRVPVL